MRELYRVIRDYGEIKTLELVWAKNEDDVYSILSWEKTDKPRLMIEKETRRKGCILSVTTRESKK